MLVPALVNANYPVSARTCRSMSNGVSRVPPQRLVPTRQDGLLCEFSAMLDAYSHHRQTAYAAQPHALHAYAWPLHLSPLSSALFLASSPLHLRQLSLSPSKPARFR